MKDCNRSPESFMQFFVWTLRNPSIVFQFPHGLIDLTLSGSELTEDPVQSLSKLPNLRSPKLFAKSYLGKNMQCSEGGFPQLRLLKLRKLEQLEDGKWRKERCRLFEIWRSGALKGPSASYRIVRQESFLGD